MDLTAQLPELLPLAIAWAEEQEALALEKGVALGAVGCSLARTAGVRQPGKIRIVVARTLPYPAHPLLQEAAAQAGILGPDTVGLTLGHAVFLLEGREADLRLVSHELRHVQQYENAGSIRDFLPVYLRQVIELGYDNSPLERDAREHELAFP